MSFHFSLKATLVALALTIVPALAADPFKIGALEITGPFTRANLPGAQVGAGFMTITNTGADADRLVSGVSTAAKTVQIHEMAVVDGVMKMQELPDGLEIPAGGSVDLKPGGFHVMFIDITAPFVEGSTVTVTLNFAKAGSVEVPLRVEAADAKSMGDMGNMDMGGMDMPADDSAAVVDLLKKTFETPDKPLGVAPVVVADGWAIAGWVQGDMGGRALLKKGDMGWVLHMCAGDGIKDAAALEKIGLSAATAKTLADDLAVAEAKLDPALVAKFSLFEGMMVMDGSAQ